MKNTIRLYTSGRKEELKEFENLLKFVHQKSATHFIFEILNVFENPVAAKKDSIVVTPTIICKIPEQPPRKVMGNIGNFEKTAIRLGVSWS